MIRIVGSGFGRGRSFRLVAVVSTLLFGLRLLGLGGQEVIIDHARSPRNFRELEGATRTVEAVNPLCGDQLTLYLQLADVAFEGNGCAISQASASLMTMALKGLAQDEALVLFTRVHTMLTTESDGDAQPPEVGKLAVLSGVWEYPTRVKCATLAWQALRSALEDAGRRDETE